MTTLSPGAKSEMSDSEIMTLALVMDYLPFPGETQFIGFVRANYGPWFPDLGSQSQFNRRWRRLGTILETLRRKWVRQLGGENANSFVIDTKPIPVMGYRRSKSRSNFYGSADANAKRSSRRKTTICANALRYCAARKMSARHAATPSSLCNRAVEVFWLQTGHALNP